MEISNALLPVSSFTPTASTGAECDINCLTKESLAKSQTMQVKSLEPETMML